MRFFFSGCAKRLGSGCLLSLGWWCAFLVRGFRLDCFSINGFVSNFTEKSNCVSKILIEPSYSIKHDPTPFNHRNIHYKWPTVLNEPNQFLCQSQFHRLFWQTRTVKACRTKDAEQSSINVVCLNLCKITFISKGLFCSTIVILTVSELELTYPKVG